MHRRQRPATSGVWAGTLVVSLALSLMFVGNTPAHAASGGDRVTPRAAPVVRDRPPVVYRTSIPKWAHGDGAQRTASSIHTANVDWQWLKAGWEIKFNWAETRQMARGFSYCTVIAALLPTGISQAVAAACGVLWIFADSARQKGKCVKIFVPLSLVGPTIGTWSCPR